MKKKPNKLALKLIFTPIFVALIVAFGIGNYYATLFFDTITEFFHGSTAVFEGEEVEKALANGDKLNIEIEEEGAVLFRNEDMNRHVNGSHSIDYALPLKDEETRKINVFGWSASDRGWVAGSDGSCNANGGINKNKYDSILDSFDNAKIGNDDHPIQYNQELIDLYEDFRIGRAERRGLTGHDQFFMLIEPNVSSYNTIGAGGKTLLQNAKDFSDVAIVVISRLGGENNDLPYYQLKNTTGDYTDSQTLPRDDTRTYLDVSTEEEDLLQMVRENFRKVIVIYNGCNNMNLEFLERFDLDACLSVNGTGQSGVDAIPEILSGQVNPSGKSVQIQPYDLKSDPTFYNCGKRANNSHQITYAEDIYVGYRFYETADAEGYWNYVSNDFGTGYNGVVQYPFGYGLSYTNFNWEIESVSPEVGSSITADTEFTVTVDVTNIGDCAGKDVVELYYSAPHYRGQIEKSSINLCAFAKTSELEPNQTERLTLKFNAYDMASYDCYDLNHNRNYGYELDKGTYQVKLMRDSHTVDSCVGAVMNFKVDQNIKFRNDPVTGNRVENRFTNYTIPVKQANGSFEQVTINAYANCALDGSDATQAPVKYVSRDDFGGTIPTSTLPGRSGPKVSAAVNYVPDLSNEVSSITTGVDSGLRLLTKQDGSYLNKSELSNGVKNAKVNEELMLKIKENEGNTVWTE